ncbi:MAG: hypothetical protein ACFFE4_04145 [Candidatus Thorarchaeota archaeon]
MIILTGFGPYDKYEENISGKIVNGLKESAFGMKLMKAVLPVSWKFCIESYKQLLNKASNPKLAMLLGIHNSKSYNLETYSWNIAFGKDIRHRFRLGPIRLFSKLNYKTTLNLEKLFKSLYPRLKIRISYFAGYYLCNFIYYWALLLSENKYPVVFIHIPYNAEQEEGLKIIEEIISSILSTDPNMRY